MDEALSNPSVPTYAELLERTDAPAGTSWGLFGPDDELGSVNFMTAERVVEAMKLVKRGKVFNLDYPINVFDPPLFSGARGLAKHNVFARHEDSRDDWLDGFYLQGTTQIDGLRHRRHHDHGFYNGVANEEIREGTSVLGIDKWAESAIIGRGVLIDVAAYLALDGRQLDHENGEPISVDLLDEVARHQDVEFRPGDILMVRTGWAKYLLEDAPASFQESQKDGLRAAGILQSRETVAWLWDHQFTLIAADNIAFEAFPIAESSPFETVTDGGMIHQELIGSLGFAIGEVWQLDKLAADCAATGVYDSAVIAKPLNLRGGVGSPANACALR